MTRTTIATALTTTALAAALLSGCGGTGDPSASGSSMPNVEPAPSSSASSPAPSPSSSSAPSSPASSPKPSGSVEMAGAPGVPKAARRQTRAGATAFVRHYFNEMNRAWALPKAGLLDRLALNSCETCDNYEATAVQAVKSGHHLDGPSATIKGIQAVELPHGYGVTVRELINARRILDSSGNTVDHVEEAKEVERFEVKWTSGGWRVSKIYEVK